MKLEAIFEGTTTSTMAANLEKKYQSAWVAKNEYRMSELEGVATEYGERDKKAGLTAKDNPFNKRDAHDSAERLVNAWIVGMNSK